MPFNPLNNNMPVNPLNNPLNNPLSNPLINPSNINSTVNTNFYKLNEITQSHLDQNLSKDNKKSINNQNNN